MDKALGVQWNIPQWFIDQGMVLKRAWFYAILFFEVAIVMVIQYKYKNKIKYKKEIQYKRYNVNKNDLYALLEVG